MSDEDEGEFEMAERGGTDITQDSVAGRGGASGSGEADRRQQRENRGRGGMREQAPGDDMPIPADDDNDAAAKRTVRCSTADMASVSAALTVTIALIGAQVLCVYDGMCFDLEDDPAVTVLMAWTPPLVIALLALLLAPLASRAATSIVALQRAENEASAIERGETRGLVTAEENLVDKLVGHRRVVLLNGIFTAIWAITLAILGIISLDFMRRDKYVEDATRDWESYSEQARDFYGSPDQVASRRMLLMQHNVLCTLAAGVGLAFSSLASFFYIANGIEIKLTKTR